MVFWEFCVFLELFVDSYGLVCLVLKINLIDGEVGLDSNSVNEIDVEGL